MVGGRQSPLTTGDRLPHRISRRVTDYGTDCKLTKMDKIIDKIILSFFVFFCLFLSFVFFCLFLSIFIFFCLFLSRKLNHDYST